MNASSSVVRIPQAGTRLNVLPKNVEQRAWQRHPAVIPVTSSAVVHWTESRY